MASWDGLAEETAPPAKRARNSGSRVASAIPPPIWTPRLIISKAQKMDTNIVTQVFTGALRGAPNQFKLALAKLLSADTENVVYQRLQENLDKAVSELSELVEEGDEIDGSIGTFTNILAAYLGATESKLAPQSTWLPELTLYDDGPEATTIKPELRKVVQFEALTTAKPMLTDGVVTCYCGKEAAFLQQMGWGQSAQRTMYWACRNGRCRMWVTSRALHSLADLMARMGVQRIPCFYCSAHPGREVRIDEITNPDGSTYLQARCPAVEGEANARRYCIKETLGDEFSPLAVTGKHLWCALDLVTRDK